MAELTLLPQLSPSSSPEALPLGSITPRLWTRPLRKLTPETSYGFAVIWFAAHVLLRPLDPWQQWLVIHAGELLEDGRPRFRQVLVLVARQNGKTHLCIVLTLYWLFVEKWPLVFGTSTNLEQAAEPWEAACELAEGTPTLAAQLPRNAVRKANGQQTLTTSHRTKYKIGAVSPRGGRGKSIDRIVGDELREHRSWAGYRAAFNAMNARPNGQAIYITNQGDVGSVVLNTLHKSALDEDDPRLGLFEWSAPDGCHPMDPAAWAAANPQLGRRMDYDTIRGPALRVSKPGADPEDLAGFQTEALCMAVRSMKAAIDPVAWSECGDPAPIDVAGGAQVAACVDVALDGAHITLAVATRLSDGRVRTEVVGAWDSVPAARAAVAEWAKRNKPYVLGWFPGGPAASLDADWRDRRKDGLRGWPPRGVKVEAIKASVDAVCMGFAQHVRDHLVVHSRQELADTHVGNAERRMRGPDGGWVYDRREGAGHIDAVYAMAGAVHLARTAPVRRKATNMSAVPS
jgi:phage terminase large subunit-like protein